MKPVLHIRPKRHFSLDVAVRSLGGTRRAVMDRVKDWPNLPTTQAGWRSNTCPVALELSDLVGEPVSVTNRFAYTKVNSWALPPAVRRAVKRLDRLGRKEQRRRGSWGK